MTICSEEPEIESPTCFPYGIVLSMSIVLYNANTEYM